MPNLTELDPASTNSNDLWVATNAATIHEATNGNDDGTYARLPADTDFELGTFEVALDSYSPPADHEVHRVRVRGRGLKVGSSSSGMLLQATFDVGGIEELAPKLANLENSVQQIIGSWAELTTFPSSYPVTTNLEVSAHQRQSTQLRATRVYLVVDARAKPSFTADVKDAAGASQAAGTVADTNKPRLEFSGLDQDELPGENWSVDVEDDNTSEIVFSTNGTGTPPAQVITNSLPIGDYTASLQCSTHIGKETSGKEFSSDVETVSFSVSFSSTFDGESSVLSELRLHASALPRRRGAVGIA